SVRSCSSTRNANAENPPSLSFRTPAEAERDSCERCDHKRRACDGNCLREQANAERFEQDAEREENCAGEQRECQAPPERFRKADSPERDPKDDKQSSETDPVSVRVDLANIDVICRFVRFH